VAEIQRGRAERVDGTVYLFNPGADDRFSVASVAVRF
jgi:hypothetical protein